MTNPSNRKLTKDQVKFIRKALDEGAEQVVLARRYGVSKQTINDIKMRRSWKDLKE